MASQAHVLVWGGSAYDTDFAVARLNRLESLWSRFRSDSEVSVLNRSQGQPQRVSVETCELVARMCDAWRLTEGAFDPTVLPVLVDGGYRTSIVEPFVDTQLSSTCAEAAGGMEAVVVDKALLTVTFPVGLCIDPGGIGKGLAAEIVAEELVEDGARGALVNIGGDLAAVGESPETTGWTISVESPQHEGTTIAAFSIPHGAVATSSTLRRRFGGTQPLVHHIIDPTTKTSSASSVAAVTTVGGSAWWCEASAKAILIHHGDPVALAERFGVEAIITYLDGRHLATSGLRPWLTDNHTRFKNDNIFRSAS